MDTTKLDIIKTRNILFSVRIKVGRTWHFTTLMKNQIKPCEFHLQIAFTEINKLGGIVSPVILMGKKVTRAGALK